MQDAPFLMYARHEHCLTGESPEQATSYSISAGTAILTG
mgnify:CR=1 FL=1